MSILVDDALVQSFIDADFGLPIVHENVDYNPTPGTAFAELRVLKNTRSAETINETDNEPGIFRIALNYPSGDGAVTAKQKAEAIVANYPINSTVTAGGQSVRVTQTQRGNGSAESGWFKIIVLIYFESLIAR